MKKRKEMEKEAESEIKSAIEELSLLVKLKKPSEDLEEDAHQHIPTRPFLHLCNLMIQILDKIGPTMAVLRQDIHQNIQAAQAFQNFNRLEMVCESDPSRYSSLVEILRKEQTEGSARKKPSSSRSVLWLTRSLDFTVALLQKLVKEPGEHTMECIVEEAYNATLKPYHGWISLAAFKIALKLVPDPKSFINLMAVTKEGNHEITLKEDVQTFVSLLSPMLEEIHSILRSYRLDKLKAT